MCWHIINVHLKKTFLSLDLVLLTVQMLIFSYLVTKKFIYVLVLVRVNFKKLFLFKKTLFMSGFFLSWLKTHAHEYLIMHTMQRNLVCVCGVFVDDYANGG